MIALLGVGCVLLAGATLYRAEAGLSISRVQLGPTPVTVFGAADGAPPRATVVIAHGFAGSQQLMRPFAVTLARNGYRAVTFDFYGHGRNLEPLAGDITRVDGATRHLVLQTGQVIDFALTLPQEGSGLALLGHSMATDVLVRRAADDGRVDAVVAVSMFSPAVTAESPANLLMLVGGWETALRSEALRVLGLGTALPEEGVTIGDFADGSARRVAVAPGVEHVGVLYSETSMRESVSWLNAVFADAAAPGYLDARGGAITLLLLGIGGLGWPLAQSLPRLAEPAASGRLSWRVLLPIGLIPAIATPLLLMSFPTDFLSVLVGGYLAVHFCVYGLLTAVCRWWLVERPGRRAVPHRQQHFWLQSGMATLLATAHIAGIVALALDRYVTSFAITTPRVPLVLAMLVGTLVYFLVDEALTRGPAVPRGARLFSHACFLLSLLLAVALSFEDLFFLLIIAAVIVLYFFVYGLFGGWIYRATGLPAVGAVASAVAFAWALAVVFPMLSG